MKALSATLRLQFHPGFTLDDAAALVPYFARLGISHLYASPLLKARPGSLHGYDVVDPTVINPQLGGEAALERLVARLREHGMGLLLDIVSNHMAVGGADNHWWLDLLEWGRTSPYAEFYDIQWHSPDPLLEGQLLLPFLASDYGAVLQAGEVPLRFDARTGSFYVEHYEHRFPISPPDYGRILGSSEQTSLKELGLRFAALRDKRQARSRARTLREELATLAVQAPIALALESLLERFDSRTEDGFERLHQLLEKQHYRLASWRTAADDINWRRFFDINELGGLRVERPTVFEATHGKIFELIGKGLIDGLRIDHIDGLADPRGYCRKLRRRVNALLAQRPMAAAVEHFPIYVEKILGSGETLHRDWQVDGTTGYDFMNQVSLLQHDPAGEDVLRESWSNLSGRPADFNEEVRQARLWVLNGTLAGDFESVAQALLNVARGNLMTRDLTLGAIRRALQALVVHYPVYRTYLNACGRPSEDEGFFQQAVEGARASLSESDWPVLASLQHWLGGEGWRRQPPGRARKMLRNACVRFQQLTSPTAAKAVEDTAFYRSAVLLSRNDVGFDAQHFSAPAEAFHAACEQRLATFPDNLLATATHDHKRGEDTRARLAVLSERSTWFSARLEHWMELATPLRDSVNDPFAPSAGDEIMLYQTLLGSWPLGLDSHDHAGCQAYGQRLHQWQQKALREAKLASSWSAPNEDYETACALFLDSLMLDAPAQQLRASIADAAHSIACAGAINSLAQCLLRMTVPGVPDLYQGCEFWDFSLVDPDNRQPVDYAVRRAALDAERPLMEQLQHWQDGHLKLTLIARTLDWRAQYQELFARGNYQPLEVEGKQADQVVAFLRENDDHTAIVVVPRLACALLGNHSIALIPPQRWDDTRIILPPAASTFRWKGLFGEPVVTPDRALRLDAALKEFPVNLFITH